MTDTEMKMVRALVHCGGTFAGLAKAYARRPDKEHQALSRLAQEMTDECLAAIRLVIPDFDHEEATETLQ